MRAITKRTAAERATPEEVLDRFEEDELTYLDCLQNALEIGCPMCFQGFPLAEDGMRLWHVDEKAGLCACMDRELRALVEKTRRRMGLAVLVRLVDWRSR